jgi:hypothetical protein
MGIQNDHSVSDHSVFDRARVTMVLGDVSLHPPPVVPWPWRISWSHFAVPLARRDVTQIGESIFCAACGPFVIELGIWTRQDRWAYDVIVNHGPFCGGAHLVDQRFDDPGAAVQTLQHWLDTLAAACIADGTALAAITRPLEPTPGFAGQFTPPQGPGIANPCSKYVRSLLWWQSAGYWLGGSGDAAVTFKDVHGHTVSELIFLLREPYGVFLQFQSRRADTMVASRLSDGAGGNDEVTLTLCGAPLTLRKTMFVDRNTAADIVTEYIDAQSGERPRYDHWIEAS